jgi:methylaspartate mutase sigma subunit
VIRGAALNSDNHFLGVTQMTLLSYPDTDMRAEQASGLRVLLSTTSSDSHTWNMVFLHLLLEESGHRVINLGPCVPDDLLVESARLHQPDAIVITTVNGHGQIDGARVVRALREKAATRHIPVMIGGQLGIDGPSTDDQVRRLLAAGFDAVFIPAADPAQLPAALAQIRPARTALKAGDVSHGR